MVFNATFNNISAISAISAIFVLSYCVSLRSEFRIV